MSCDVANCFAACKHKPLATHPLRTLCVSAASPAPPHPTQPAPCPPSCRKGCIIRLQRHLHELLLDQLPVLRQLSRVLDEMSLGIDNAAAAAAATGNGASASRLILEQVCCCCCCRSEIGCQGFDAH